MAGQPGRSGGWNKLSPEQHRQRGTWRADRHGAKLAPVPPSPPVTPADRKRTLAGLDTSARRIAAALMDSFEGWHAGTLVVLRQYALSCGRLETIADDAERRREQRANLALLKALDLQP